MSSKREQILARLLVVLGTVEGVAYTARNDLAVSDTKLPALILLDADEEADERAEERGHAGAGPNLVTMLPQIALVQQAPPGQLGSDLNTLLARVQKAVLFDAMLLSLAGPNGNVRYRGMTNALGIGRSLQGDAMLSFALKYVLRPSDL